MIRTHNNRGRRKTKDEMISEYYSEFMYRCECSHTQLIPNQIDKVICTHCGKWIYRDKKLEFKDRMKNLLKKRG